ncbi:4-hydroxy-3-methylbut-2-en-1-yl diphosphate synthase [Marinosulfonomonas sp. PRT-SC04]|nr:4-hydroxy-3-methylbut-2-en-1-yl diphosphate synthase [Marinosulfonomonas sp. PRT-SC04]
MIRRMFSSKKVEAEVVSGFDSYDLHLGDVMRGERATLGKSLLDVQRELKIKASFIAAIENSDPDAFDSPSFIAGYVRSYARYLGLDPEWAFQEFCKESDYQTAHGMSSEASSGALTAAKAAPRERLDPLSDPNAAFVPQQDTMFGHIEPGAIGSVLVLVALIAGIGYGGWSVLQEVQRVQFAPVEQSPNVTASVDPLAASDDVLAALDQTSGFVAPPPDALDRLYRPKALDVPVMVARDGPISALNPQRFGALAADDALNGADLRRVMAGLETPELFESTNTGLVQVLTDGVPEVSIFAINPAWVRVTSADGTVIFEKVLDAGEKFVLPKTEEPPTLRTGYAGTVYFAVNGKTYGPAGEGASVVSKIALGEADIIDNFQLADLSTAPALAKVVAALSAASDE